MLSLTAFGAKPDDSSQAARATNAAAWLAAMQYMGAEPNLRTHILVISGGSFYFPGSLFMARPCIIQGEGGSSNSISKLYFPYNGAGIVADLYASPDDPGPATWGKIENLDIFNEGSSSIVQRRLNWKYAPGDIVVSPGNDDLMFKCAVGGVTVEPSSLFDNASDGDKILEANGATSIVWRKLNLKYAPGDIVISPGNNDLLFKCVVGGATVEPSAVFDSASDGDTIVELNGTTWLVLKKATWQAIPKAALKISLWQPNTPYQVGDIVLSNGFDLASQHYGDSRFSYVCTIAGTSGSGTDPFGSQDLDSYVMETAGPTWRVVAWSAILMRSSIHVDNVMTAYWPNAAIHVNSQSSERDGNANNFVLTNVKSLNDGMGIYVFGNNANVGFIGYCQVIGPGTFNPGLGGHGFWDHSTSGCAWINNYAEDGSGAGWISDSVSKSTWIGNVSEMPMFNIVRQGAATSLTSTNWHPTMTQQLANFDLHDGRQITTTDCTSRVTTRTNRGSQGWIDRFWSTDEQNNFIGRIYNYDSWRMGWYTDHLEGTNGAFIGGISGVMAPEGPGHSWIAAGMFIGTYTEKRYFGFDPEMLNSNRLREGQRYVGDGFITNPFPRPGEWMGVIVTKAGTKGPGWNPSQPYLQNRVGEHNSPADIVEPGDGFAYACTRSGTSGTAPPLFNTSTTMGENAPVWTPISRYWPKSKVRPTAANGHYYQMKKYLAWTPNTPISPNQITTTSDSNGNLFFAYVQTWGEGIKLMVGQHMQPTVPNGKAYRVKKIIEGSPTPAFGSTATCMKTGTCEPNWSLLVLPTDELIDGDVIWQLDQLRTGQLEPPGVQDGQVGWDTRAGHVTYDNNIEWRCFIPKTGSVEPAWNVAPGSETVEAPKAKPITDSSGVFSGVEDGFGVVWLESGLDPKDSKVLDNGCEWTRIDSVPQCASIMQVGPVNSACTEKPVINSKNNEPLALNPMSLKLDRLRLTNVDDAAGRWQFEGGQVFQEESKIADYASTKRVVTNGTEAQNTATLTLTLFFIDQPHQSAGNMTLQGSHNFNSGEEIGSVSAVSTAFAYYIGKQFKRSGPHLIIGP
jgi:hypothetical protein